MIIMNYECDDAVLEEEKSIALELSEYGTRKSSKKPQAGRGLADPLPYILDVQNRVGIGQHGTPPRCRGRFLLHLEPTRFT